MFGHNGKDDADTRKTVLSLTQYRMLDQGYGIMPNKILFDKDLSDKEKLLFCFISSLCAEKGYCWASNGYLGEKLDISGPRVSGWISSLQKKGYICVYVNKEDGNKRTITIAENSKTYCGKQQEGIAENSKTPIAENGKHNNTSINITNTIPPNPQGERDGIDDEKKLKCVDPIEKYFENRNQVGKFKKCQQITSDIKKAWRDICKQYTKEQIIQGTKNYIEDIANRDQKSSYALHRFSLYEFLKQGNGLKLFINK